MTQPAGKTTYKVTVDNTDAVAAWKAIQEAARVAGITIKKVADNTKETGRASRGAAGALGGFFSGITGQAAAAVSSLVSVQAALSQIRRELEFAEQRRQTALDTRVAVGEAQRRANFTLQPHKGLTESFVQDLVFQNAQPRIDPVTGVVTGGAGLAGGFNVATKVLSASGVGTTKEDTASAFAIGTGLGTLLGLGPEQTGTLAASLLDIKKQSGVRTAAEAAGVLSFSLSGARIQGVEEAAESLPGAFAVGRAFGADPGFTAALINVLTGSVADVSGKESITAAVNVFRNLFQKRLLPETQTVTRLKRVKGALVPVTEQETVLGGLPLAIDPSGRSSPVVEALAQGIRRIGQRGILAPVRNFVEQASLGTLTGAIPDDEDIIAFAERKFRDPLGALRFARNVLREATPEQRSDFAQGITSRGKFRPVVGSLFFGDPERFEQLASEVERARSFFAAGGERLTQEFTDFSKRSFDEFIILQKANEVVGEEISFFGGEKQAKFALAQNALRTVLERLPDTSDIGKRITEARQLLDAVSAGEKPSAFLIDELNAIRKRFAPTVQSLTPRGTIPGGTATGTIPNPKADPQLVAALDRIIGLIQQTETISEQLAASGTAAAAKDAAAGVPAEATPSPSPTPSPSSEPAPAAREDVLMPVGSGGVSALDSQQIMLIDTGATPFYPADRPLAGGVGAN